MVRFITLTVAAFLCVSISAAFAQDIDGAIEHPMMTERYPGQEIRWQRIENYMPYKVPLGPVTGYRTIGDTIETAGLVTRTFYVYEGADRTYTEIWKNYSDAFKAAGFTVLAEGIPAGRAGRSEFGGRTWMGAHVLANPWHDRGAAVDMLVHGTSTQGESAAIVATRERAAGTVYVTLIVEQHDAETVGMLVDIVEVGEAETGLVSVDPEAIGNGITEYGRVVLDGIVFDFDSATLLPESEAALSAMATYLSSNPEMQFYVVGHTDQVGSFNYNRTLSANRAQAVVEALVNRYGAAAGRLEAHGVGPLSPVFSNGTDAGRDRNRRVELVER